MSNEIDLTTFKQPIEVHGTCGGGLTFVKIGGKDATHFTLKGNVLQLGKKCLSCGVLSDPFGNIPCGH
jgi:hypothetical protein